MSVLTRKAASFARLPAFVLWRLLPTWVLLGLARLLILLVPFRRLAPRLGQLAGNTLVIPLANPAQIARARAISRLVQTTARYCPWTANCFPQAMVAHVWLLAQRLPHALYFGVNRTDSGELEAHAWVNCGPIAVTGGHSFHRFTVVGTFLSDTELSRQLCADISPLSSFPPGFRPNSADNSPR